MTIRKFRSGGRFEQVGSYCRAKRVGPFVYVAGTTAIEPSGRIHEPGDTYAQTLFVLNRIEEALREVGAERRHVMRTRCYLAELSQAAGFVRAHGEFFRGIDPVMSGVGARLSQPGLMVEIDVDAIVHDESGALAFTKD